MQPPEDAPPGPAGHAGGAAAAAWPSVRTLRVGVAGGLGAFLLILADVRWQGLLFRLDRDVASRVRAELRPATRHWMENVVSSPGHDVVVVAVLLATAAACLLLGRWRHALAAVPVGAMALGMVWTLKAWLARPRPSGEGHSFAFPSGHATDTAVAYALAAMLVWDAWRLRQASRGLAAGPAWVPWALGAAWAAVLATVAAARVLGGVHWPTDVVAGAALGTAYACAVVLTLRALDRRWPGRGDARAAA